MNILTPKQFMSQRKAMLCSILNQKLTKKIDVCAKDNFCLSNNIYAQDDLLLWYAGIY